MVWFSVFGNWSVLRETAYWYLSVSLCPTGYQETATLPSRITCPLAKLILFCAVNCANTVCTVRLVRSIKFLNLLCIFLFFTNFDRVKIILRMASRTNIELDLRCIGSSLTEWNLVSRRWWMNTWNRKSWLRTKRTPARYYTKTVKKRGWSKNDGWCELLPQTPVASNLSSRSLMRPGCPTWNCSSLFEFHGFFYP